VSIELHFNPFPLFSGSHQQTILGSMIKPSRSLESTTKHIELADKDIIALEVSTPKQWQPNKPTVVMIHGLCGSHKSTYLIRIGKKLKKRNIRAIRVNLRGCGSGKGLARNTYHCGQSEDILQILRVLKEESPESDMILVGFSLGGNLVLKLAGELRTKASEYLRMVVAINPPADLYGSIQKVGKPVNRFYEKYFF